MAEAYPLQWPVGKVRTRSPRRARFGRNSIAYYRDELLRELNMMRARDIVISSNLRLRTDGMLHGNQAQPKDPGVAVYFTLDKQQYCFSCDRWDLVEHNMWAIAKTIEATRGIERWGAATVKESFAGFKALPAPDAKKHWTEVFGMPADTPAQEVSAKYREIMKTAHPDAGGSTVQAAEINAAYDEFRRERNLK